MKPIWLGVIFIAFVFAPTVSVGSAVMDHGVGRTAVAIHTLNTGTFLIASFNASPQDFSKGGRPDHEKGKGKDKDRDKGRFHGAEMNTTAVAIAGLFAISAYLLFVRRNTHKRA